MAIGIEVALAVSIEMNAQRKKGEPKQPPRDAQNQPRHDRRVHAITPSQGAFCKSIISLGCHNQTDPLPKACTATCLIAPSGDLARISHTRCGLRRFKKPTG